ncbi:A24 family peptidase [Paraburkholderia flava]|uniref:A24 family peptidase n=1 Tax=Paraburkholderia flava TaxID=2547393 RepID=UPI0010613400|nr:prepilin peptidase [Paraburkholderia flava]
MSASISNFLFVAWVMAVAVSDCRSRRVSNTLVAAGLVAALASAFLFHGPFGLTPMQAVTGMIVGLAALLPFYMLGVMGGADVKVFAVLGAWCGIHALLTLWIVASLIAAVHAIALLVITRTRVSSLVQQGARTFQVAGHRSTPYAACLSVPAIALLAIRASGGGV